MTAPLGEIVAAGIELLDAVIAGIRDIDVALAVHRHAIGPVELAVASAVAAPLGEIVAVGVELLDAVIISAT